MDALRNEEEYEAALARIERLMDAELGTPEGEEFELLADLINDYEDLHYPFPPKIVSEPATEEESEPAPVSASG